MAFLRRFTMALVLMTLGLAGCASDSGNGPDPTPGNRAPSITVAHSEIRVVFTDGDTVTITASVSDPDQDTLTITWSLEGPGSLDVATGASVVWSVDDTLGEAVITATVSDGTLTDDDEAEFLVGSSVAPGDVPDGTTWTAAGSPYVVRDDIRVPAGSSLVVAAGARVMFQGDFEVQSSAYQKPVVEVEGTLHVQGQPGGLPSLGVVFEGGRTLAANVQQHRGLVYQNAGSGTLAYATVKDGDAAVTNQGTGSLSMFRCQFIDNVAGYTGTGSRDAGSPVTLRACRISGNAGNGVFVRNDHVRVVGSNLEANLGSGILATVAGDLTTADLDSCVVRSNEAANLRIGNTGPAPGSQLLFNVNACNLDQPAGGTTMTFDGCGLSFFYTLDITGNYWLQAAASTAAVLGTMANWEACEPDLADWEQGVHWLSSPVQAGL